MDDQNETHVSTTDARSGSTPKVTRVVLVASMILIVVAFTVIVAFKWY